MPFNSKLYISDYGKDDAFIAKGCAILESMEEPNVCTVRTFQDKPCHGIMDFCAET